MYLAARVLMLDSFIINSLFVLHLFSPHFLFSVYLLSSSSHGDDRSVGSESKSSLSSNQPSPYTPEQDRQHALAHNNNNNHNYSSHNNSNVNVNSYFPHTPHTPATPVVLTQAAGPGSGPGSGFAGSSSSLRDLLSPLATGTGGNTSSSSSSSSSPLGGISVNTSLLPQIALSGSGSAHNSPMSHLHHHSQQQHQHLMSPSSTSTSYRAESKDSSAGDRDRDSSYREKDCGGSKKEKEPPSGSGRFPPITLNRSRQNSGANLLPGASPGGNNNTTGGSRSRTGSELINVASGHITMNFSNNINNNMEMDVDSPLKPSKPNLFS